MTLSTCNAGDYGTGSTASSFIGENAFNSEKNRKDNVRYDQSEIKEKVETWLEDQSEIIAKKEYIDDQAEWCIDMSEPAERTFGATTRLLGNNPSGPSLKCDFTGKSDSKAVTYKSEVGLLSADEVAFAGGSSDRPVLCNYYLCDNAVGSWWTLSPYGLPANLAHVLVVATGTLNFASTSNSSNLVRPALVLKSSTPVKNDGGIGTKGQPYVVE